MTALRKRLPMDSKRAGEAIPEMVGEEGDDLTGDLEVGDVGVEVDAVEALEVEGDVLGIEGIDEGGVVGRQEDLRAASGDRRAQHRMSARWPRSSVRLRPAC